MKYDIAAKILLELAKKEILQNFLGIKVSSAELIDELPGETFRVKRDDFPMRVKKKSGKDIIVVLELQTSWDKKKCLDLLDYRNDFKRKYELPVKSCMMLFTKSGTAKNFYKDEEVVFRFNLIKMWELPAKKYASEKFIKLWPFVPLMKGGLKLVDKIERELYKSNIPRDVKMDLLTILFIFTGLMDEKLAIKLLERRRDLMIESPIYDVIKNEGREEEKLETARKLIKKNFSVDEVIELTGLKKEDLEKAEIIKTTT